MSESEVLQRKIDDLAKKIRAKKAELKNLDGFEVENDNKLRKIQKLLRQDIEHLNDQKFEKDAYVRLVSQQMNNIKKFDLSPLK